ncbi:MAG: Asp-tRNA(Asn)/Glu-tRNA(Gln) amidotransferase subunit GatB [Lentisphaeria bacterium]|nr:Asp-tRNA(Asn)/Glu-tRNA(Gln) amidotransferase subunit GatB [Lentisphaeria bacterium]
MDYEAVIGLEVHTQLLTRSKMFCGCANDFGGEPNTRVCPICLGYPGVLPVVNREAVRKTLVAGLMCGCEVTGVSTFDRKNYFYPDMPKDYQISQFDRPLCRGGGILLGGSGFSGDPLEERTVRLTRMHLEEDTGKLTHLGRASAVDFNRAGLPLLEIVTEPDMRTADEAHAFLTELKQLMQYADVSTCDMEKGQMRCDVNVSVRPRGQETLGEKVEIKNLNSFRAVHRALCYEIGRQADELDRGGRVLQETRGWDDAAGVTFPQRIKEEAHDYRYFREPDLMPLETTAESAREIAALLPEAPRHRRQRLVRVLGLTGYDAAVLTSDKALADYYERAAAASPDPKAVANWMITEMMGALSAAGIGLADCPVAAESLGELVSLVAAGSISGKQAKGVFGEMFRTGRGPGAIVAAQGLSQVSDTDAIGEYAAAAIAANPDAVAQYRAGRERALQYLVGQVLRLSRGKANPRLAVEQLRRRLGPQEGES